MSLEEIIAQIVAENEEPNPHVLAPLVLAEIVRELRPILGDLLPDAIREYIRHNRSTTGDITTSSRWGGVSATTKAGDFVPGKGWVFREDLTADDCRAVAQGYFSRAEQNEAMGKFFLDLAERLEREGKARVGDLLEEAS